MLDWDTSLWASQVAKIVVMCHCYGVDYQGDWSTCATNVDQPSISMVVNMLNTPSDMSSQGSTVHVAAVTARPLIMPRQLGEISTEASEAAENYSNDGTEVATKKRKVSASKKKGARVVKDLPPQLAVDPGFPFRLTPMSFALRVTNLP